MTFEWTRRPAVQKAARIAGYSAFGIMVFAVSVVLTFPTARLRGYLEARLSQGGTTVRIQDLSVRGLGSVRLYGVKVDLAPDRVQNPDGTVLEEPRSVALDRLDVSVGLFRMLFGSLKVDATAYAGEGVLGPVTVHKTAEQVTIDVEDARDFPLPSDLPVFGVRFSGKLTALKASGTYEIKGGLAASKGRLELKAEGLRAVKPTLRSAAQGNVSLSDVDLGGLLVELNLDKRSNLSAFKADRKAPGGDATVLHVEKAELDGQDVKALIEGHSIVRLAPGKTFKEGQLTVELAFSLSDAFIDRQVRSGGEVSTPNRFLRTLLSMDPKWRTAQSGSYWGVLCSGSVDRPSCLPKKPTIRGGDFKAPAKAEDKGEAKDAASRAPVTPPKTTPAPSNAPVVTPPPAPTPAPVAAPPPRQEPPRQEPPRQEPPRQEPPAQPPVEPPASAGSTVSPAPAATGTVLTPTVIGRARVRGLTPNSDGEEAPGPAGEAPAPAAPTTAPAAGEGEGQE